METNVIGHVKSPNRRGFTLVRRARFCGSGFHPLPAICVRFGRLLAFPVPLSTVFSGGHDNADLCHVLGAQDLAEHSVVRLTEGNGTILPVSKITAGDSEGQNKNRPEELTSDLRKCLVAGAGFEPTTSGL